MQDAGEWRLWAVCSLQRPSPRRPVDEALAAVGAVRPAAGRPLAGRAPRRPPLAARSPPQGHRPRRTPSAAIHSRSLNILPARFFGLFDRLVCFNTVAPHLLMPRQWPVWVLVAFGCYSLAVIGWNLATFPECKEAADELQKVAHAHGRAQPPCFTTKTQPASL